jgi:hypothetical protein
MTRRTAAVLGKIAAWAVALCLVALAAACSGGTHSRSHARAKATAGGAAATAIRGRLGLLAARYSYTTAIVPVYAPAVALADTIANDPGPAAPQTSQLTAGLHQAESRLAAVTAFPAGFGADRALAAFRSGSATVLADLAHPSALHTRAGRHKTASDLYALAHQVGVLGIALGLLPGKGP